MTPRGPDADPNVVRAVLEKALGPGVAFERTAEGVSTSVYRARRGDETFYLRLAEEPGLDLGPEVEVHRRLLAAGVRVPDIVHYESFNQDVGRSIAVTTEIAGTSLETCKDAILAGNIARDAGRDLALVHHIDVDGFGWVKRDGQIWPLRGEFASWGSWIASGIRPDADVLAGSVFDEATFAKVQRVVGEEMSRTPDTCRLVHGDFDVTPIFHFDGRYSGLIDFGEIRGAELYYDLAHFLLHDAQIAPFLLLSELLQGYTEVTTIDLARAKDRFHRTAVLIGVFRITRAVTRWGERAVNRTYIRMMSDRVVDLLRTL